MSIFLANFCSVLYKLTLQHVMKERCRQNEKIVKDFRNKKRLNCLEKVTFWKSVCEKVFYKGLIVGLMFLVLKFCVSFYHLFQCEKNVFESTDGPYPQLSVQRWVWERVQWSL